MVCIIFCFVEWTESMEPANSLACSWRTNVWMEWLVVPLVETYSKYKWQVHLCRLQWFNYRAGSLCTKTDKNHNLLPAPCLWLALSYPEGNFQIYLHRQQMERAPNHIPVIDYISQILGHFPGDAIHFSEALLKAYLNPRTQIKP